MEAEILAAMKRIKFIEAEARRRLLEEQEKKESLKPPKPMIKKSKVSEDPEPPKKVSAPKTPKDLKGLGNPKDSVPVAEAPKPLKVSKDSKDPKDLKGLGNPEDSKTPKKKQAIPHHIKTLVWNKWVGEKVAETKCLACKITGISIRHFHCGHYISEANGGDMSITNLRPICANCNLSMSTMNMSEYIKKFGLDK